MLAVTERIVNSLPPSPTPYLPRLVSSGPIFGAGRGREKPGLGMRIGQQEGRAQPCILGAPPGGQKSRKARKIPHLWEPEALFLCPQLRRTDLLLVFEANADTAGCLSWCPPACPTVPGTPSPALAVLQPLAGFFPTHHPVLYLFVGHSQEQCPLPALQPTSCPLICQTANRYTPEHPQMLPSKVQGGILGTENASPVSARCLE